jgi:hypothetical protein
MIKRRTHGLLILSLSLVISSFFFSLTAAVRSPGDISFDVNSDGVSDENFTIDGLLANLRSVYEIRSNNEVGYGRADIVMRPKTERFTSGFVVEFKSIKHNDDADMDMELKKAMLQIEKKICDRSSRSWCEHGLPYCLGSKRQRYLGFGGVLNE